jgi:hypothetical protein
MTAQSMVVMSALILCLVFTAIIADAIRRQRKTAADLAWFFDGGSFDVPPAMRGRP